MSEPTVAVLDACVLYSAALRDLFMWLTIRLVFQPKWTERIHTEWIENLLENRPDLLRANLERTRDLMNRWGRDCSVDEYDSLIDTLSLPDTNDRHILAAAIASKAFIIVTFNLTDFPAIILEPLEIRAVHPDQFLCDLLSKEPTLFVAAVHDLLDSLKNPPHTLDDLFSKFRQGQILKLCDQLEIYRTEFETLSIR